MIALLFRLLFGVGLKLIVKIYIRLKLSLLHITTTATIVVARKLTTATPRISSRCSNRIIVVVVVVGMVVIQAMVPAATM